MYGKIRITDGIINSVINKGDDMPKGFYKGITRKIK